MKILWFYKYIDVYHFDHWFHTDLVYQIRRAGHDCFAYGPGLEIKYGDLVVQKYDPAVSMAELHEKFKFDVVLLCTKSRMFWDDYCPPGAAHTTTEQYFEDWLPSDFPEWNCLKVVLEEDYHYEINNNWYRANNIQLVLQRHLSNVRRFYENDNRGIKCLWHPFSVDEKVFYPQGRDRIKRLCMAANVNHEIYIWRRMQLQTLVPIGLMDDLCEQKVIEDKYVECLNSYVGHGNCSTAVDLTPSKMFEIMASGSVLFTDHTNRYGLSELFYKDSYVTYERDWSNMISQAKKILFEPGFAEAVAKRARQCILDKHTNNRRIAEMIEILQKEL